MPEGYVVRALREADAPALASAYARNRTHLEPWDPRRDESFYTEQGQRVAVHQQLSAVRMGLMVAWLVVKDGELVGRVNLNNIVRGALHSAAVGYWVDAAHLGRGLATAAVEHAVEEARSMGLHRVEAGTLLHNAASQAVLRKCGFTEYGLAPRYLFIAGLWQDHRLFQRILHDEPPA